MVMYDKANIRKQKEILSSIINTNIDIGNEFEAQRIIFEKMTDFIREENFDNFSVNVFVNDDTKSKWKSSSKEENEFVKIFHNEISYAVEKYGVTRGELGFFYSLSEFLLWENNLLVDREGLPLNQKRLIDELKMGRTTVRSNMNSLEQKKFLIRVWNGKDVYYMINPYLMVKGQNIHKGIPKLFELIEYIPLKIKKKKSK